jgi:DNA-binding transcriptional regulator YiaG
MSQLMTAMKDEIRRIARKETRAATDGLKKDQTAFRKAVAGLRRQTKEHHAIIRQLLQAAAKQARMTPAPVEENKAWITAKGIRTLRKKLKLSQAQFGKLAGASGNTVLKWEHGAGPLKLRSKTRKALLAVRGLGVREARLRLGMR